MPRRSQAVLAALVVVVAAWVHHRSLARHRQALAHMREAIDMYMSADDLLQDCRGLVGEWQAQAKTVEDHLYEGGTT
jgi:hypothetical protein